MRDRMSKIFWHLVTAASRAPPFKTTWPRNDGLWGREWASATWPLGRKHVRSILTLARVTSGRRSWPQERLLLKLSNFSNYTIKYTREVTRDEISASAAPYFQKWIIQGCQPPTFSNIENWWWRDNKWRHNAHGTWRHLWKQNARKRCWWNCNIWPYWLSSHQSHYCLYYNGIPEFVRKRSMLTVKLLKQRKVFEKFVLSKSRFYKKW